MIIHFFCDNHLIPKSVDGSVILKIILLQAFQPSLGMLTIYARLQV